MKSDGESLVEISEDPGEEPSDLAEWAEFHERVQTLPDAEREVFDLLWYEGLGQKEVAHILGVTERTVKNRWRSAKLMLRQLLDTDLPA